jgi:hypothetical protein
LLAGATRSAGPVSRADRFHQSASSNSGVCLAVLFIGIAIGQPLTGGTKIDIVRADIDEVPPFRLELEVIGFGRRDRDARLLARHHEHEPPQRQ